MVDDFRKSVEDLERGPQSSEGTQSAAQAESNLPHDAVDAIRQRFGDAVGRHLLHCGDEHVVYVARDRAFEILQYLRNDQRFDLCKDITAIDYGGNRPLELFYELWSIPGKKQLRVKVVLPLDDLEADSVVEIWQTADWLEREAFDMFGINFRNHPDMRRILMPENYAEGHPLRKDFPLRGRFSRAEQTRRALSLELEDHYTPEEMDIGGDPANAAAAAAAEAATSAATVAVVSSNDPAFGDVAPTQRAPLPGGEASTGLGGE